MRIVFNTVDSVFRDPSQPEWGQVQETAARLRQERVPLVLCSELGVEELQQLRGAVTNRDPFIAENGGALFVPQGYFPFSIGSADAVGGYEVLRFGEKREDLLHALRRASAESAVPVEVLDLERTTFQPRGGDPAPLLTRIEKSGRRWTYNGLCYAISSPHDRRLAVMVLTRFFFQISRSVLSIGIGASLEDVDVLSSVDRPAILRTRATAEMKRLVPSAHVTQRSLGAAAWVEAVSEFVPRLDGSQPQVA